MNTSIYSQLILLNKNDTDHYLKRYVKLVSFYKERNWSYKFGLHEHHIVPESFGGKDSRENLVFITIREHFILHWILYKAFPKSSMVTAFKSMCSGWGHYSDNKVSSKVYEKVMLEFIERMSETTRERANKRVAEGKHHFSGPELQRKRIAEGRHNFSGPELQRKRIAEGTHPWQGDGELQRKNNLKRVANGEHNFLKNNIIKILCEHCNKEFSLGNYIQWHGDKCKLNPLYKKEIKEKFECPHCNRFFSKGKLTRYHGDKCKLKP